MARYDFWALSESQITVSGGEQLDGVTQGDGSHLVGETITINSKNFEQIFLKDKGDQNFDDNDSDQRLDGAQTVFGTSYGKNTVVEAEYQFVLRDPNTGDTYRVLAVNIVDSSPSYGTIEGLAFVDAIPPTGVALEVISASEGPTGGGNVQEQRIVAPPCFTPGTQIRVLHGWTRVEAIAVGDEVMTLDHGPRPVRWIGRVDVDARTLRSSPSFRPILIRKGALGGGVPDRDMLVSPQHRLLVGGWRAELLFGDPQVLAAAAHLVNGDGITVADDLDHVTYIHLQFDGHELLLSDGIVSESLNPGPVSLSALPDASREELLALFPRRDPIARPAFKPARRLLTRRETLALSA